MIVEDLSTLSLGPDDAHHLASVLRLRDGEPVGATDGRGGYVPCVWSSGRLTATGSVVTSPSRAPALTVGLVPVKGDRPEWAVQKLTELGVDRIVLLSSQRSVVRWDGPRLESHLDRLRRVARSAVMQSRQVWLPEVAGVTPVASFCAGASGGAPGAAASASSAAGAVAPAGAPRPVAAGIAVADMDGGPFPAGVHTLLIGPEGGWTDAEREMFGHAGWPTVRLGPAVLRAETAAVAAGALMAALRDGMVTTAASAAVNSVPF